MLILRAIRTLFLVSSTYARMWVGTLLLPAHSRTLLQAKGRALVALHWQGLAVDCQTAAGTAGPTPSSVGDATANALAGHDSEGPDQASPLPPFAAQVARLAGSSADRALASLAEAELLHGELYEALLSFAANPGRFRPPEASPPSGG